MTSAETVPEDPTLPNMPAPPLREAPPVDAPPPKRRGRPPGAKTRNRTGVTAPGTRTRTPQSKTPDYHKSVSTVLTLVATVAGAVSPITAACIEVQSDSVAAAWANLAHQNESVAKVLDRLGGGSAWSEAIASTAMMAGMIACANGALKGTPLDAMFRGSVDTLTVQLYPPPPSSDGPVHAGGSEPAIVGL